MLDLAFTPTQELLKNSAHTFVADQCSRTTVREIDENDRGFSPELWQHVKQMGWPGILIPERYGGLGSGFTDAAVIFEEMGWACMPSPLHSSGVLSALLILEAGNEEQKARLLPAIAAGEQILTLAYTEPEYGWGPGAVTLSARQSGGDFLLSGTKLFVPDAQVADSLIVAARTGGPGRAEDGISLFLLPKGAPGVAIRSIKGWTGDRLSEVTLANARVPSSALLGQLNKGWASLEPALDKATIILCAYMVGGMQQMLDLSSEYSRGRIAFGVPISTYQRVQDMIINIVDDLESARWATYEALWKLDEGHPEREVKEAISMAKAVASEGFARATEHAHHVHGGVSVDKSYGLYLYTKKARTLFSYLGDPQHHRRRMAELMGL